MNTVQYGQWKIAVDTERTKQYYASVPQPTDQASRNFAEYCKTMSPEERAFFDSFGIDPVRCSVHGFFMDKEKTFPCSGTLLFCGSYLEYPQENLLTIEELAAQNFVDDRPDPRVNIGIFQFDFIRQDFLSALLPNQIPEGFLGIAFFCNDMEWLLRERCQEERLYEPPRFWEIHKQIAGYFRQKKRQKAFLQEEQQPFEALFQRLSISAVPLSKKEIRRHRVRWLRAYAPADANWQELRALCLDGRGCSVFPWHIFSFKFLDCEVDESARGYFDRENKGSCILLSNVDPLAYRLEDAAKVTAEHLEEFIDVTITADDFSWTYSKTHEGMCGPYFYKKY